MNQKKKAIIFVIVGLIILSLILFYFPFAIRQPVLENKNFQNQNQSQTESIPDLENSPSKNSNQKNSTSSVENPTNGFSDLEKEAKSLDELEKELENF